MMIEMGGRRCIIKGCRGRSKDTVVVLVWDRIIDSMSIFVFILFIVIMFSKLNTMFSNFKIIMWFICYIWDLKRWSISIIIVEISYF